MYNHSTMYLFEFFHKKLYFYQTPDGPIEQYKKMCTLWKHRLFARVHEFLFVTHRFTLSGYAFTKLKSKLKFLMTRKIQDKFVVCLLYNIFIIIFALKNCHFIEVLTVSLLDGSSVVNKYCRDVASLAPYTRYNSATFVNNRNKAQPVVMSASFVIHYC